ncbi:double-stranded DNA-dependent ATPase Ecym_8005 [Eremothecium cymbalariae DBVPG|uniref:ATP-dependent helicase IRC3 n=1 Tax=Eremothecium cymbalariae (strain CBS 270.75 / DBVPG 7215 / KCTC 17166 / NRRL Y-17582) TaxID=931890 RepID=G8JXX5_ERECY|nr:Hypothetical protein Ecym_8005 [Eremothecium cymbalariae DBVPG\
MGVLNGDRRWLILMRFFVQRKAWYSGVCGAGKEDMVGKVVLGDKGAGVAGVKEPAVGLISGLRRYQQECIDQCIDCITLKGQRRIGVSLATGGGKTVIFANLLQQLRERQVRGGVVGSGMAGFRTLVLVHRRELAVQASQTIKRFFPGLNVQVEMGKLRADVVGADVVVASLQSLIRRLEEYPTDSVNLIIIDEAHHAVARSYIEVLRHFGADVVDSRVPVVGFSATFERADRKALSRVFDEIVFHKGILEMIDEEWLCDGKFTTVEIGADLTDVAVAGSDFQVGSLSRVMNTDWVNKVILQTYLHKKKLHNLKSTILFGVDIAHVTTLCELFQKHNIGAQYVTSKTRLTERDSLLEDFRQGRIEVLMNCGIFTEGTDIPNIDCILLCRPTKSRTLLVQMVGRGLRKHHTKDYCQVVDFVASSRAGVVSVPSLVGIDPEGMQFDEATLKDLELVKQELEKRRLEVEHRDALKLEEAREYARNIDARVEELVGSLSALDLTLTSYDNFRSYYETVAKGEEVSVNEMTNHQKELKLFKDSVYPWVKLGNASWGMDISQGHHIRIYKIKDLENPKESLYELKFFRKLPYREGRVVKYSPRTIIKSLDLVEVIGAVEGLINNLQLSLIASSPSSKAPKNFTKYSPWRQMAATSKQKKFVETLLEKQLDKDEQLKELLTKKNIKDFVSNISKGEASNIIFGSAQAPVYLTTAVLKSLARKICNKVTK